MTNVIFDGGELVLASEDDRIVEGRLLPFGTVGYTNVGAFTVDAGVLELPADPDVIGLNIEHDREQPVGRAVAVESRADGVYARYRIAKTPEGDQALADIRSGKRKSLSMEAKGVIVQAGKAITGRLFGSGLVAKPAFAGATVIAALNEDGSVEVDGEEVPAESSSESSYTTTNSDGSEYADSSKTTEQVEDLGNGKKRITRTTVAVTEITEPDPSSANQKEDAVANATAPETVAAAKATDENKPEAFSYRDAFRVMAAHVNGAAKPGDLDKVLTPEGSVFAAQTNVAFPVADANPAPQWVGEFWGDIAPKPLVTDLLVNDVLTSRQVQGFDVTTKPTGGDWAGNGAEITSSAVAFTQRTITASFFAGGNTISRENLDFGLADEFLNWYFTVQAQNFQSWLDGKALAAIREGATLAAKDAVPTSPAIDAGTSALIDAVSAYVTARNELPTFALIEASYWKAMLKVPATAVLGYLSAALGVDQGELSGFTIRPATATALTQTTGSTRAIKALAGNRQVAKVYTLPGSPIRVDSVNVANGLVNVGVYGYGAVVPNAVAQSYGVY